MTQVSPRKNRASSKRFKLRIGRSFFFLIACLQLSAVLYVRYKPTADDSSSTLEDSTSLLKRPIQSIQNLDLSRAIDKDLGQTALRGERQDTAEKNKSPGHETLEKSSSEALETFDASQKGAKTNALENGAAEQDAPSIHAATDAHLTQSVVVSNSTKLWHRSSSLPQWMKDYFDWFDEQRRNLTPDNVYEHKFLVMQCLRTDAQCGGASDRLKPIPLMILEAYRSKRLFFILWKKPAPLEEFLLPPEEGYNWTMPDWLVEKSQAGSRHPLVKVRRDGVEALMYTNMTFLHARFQTFHGGSDYFADEFNNTITYEDVYHDIFRTFFVPAPPVADIIRQKMNSVSLIPGEYATAHYRAFYGKHKHPSESKIKLTAINAVECASELRPGGPVYFASDSTYAVEIIQDYAHEHNRPVVVIPSPQAPLHLDKANSSLPRDYYSIFVDLYLLGMGRCGSIGNGGFGRYGLLLSYNASCFVWHSRNRERLDCQWKDKESNIN